MTPTYPEGFIQIVPFGPFAAEIFENLKYLRLKYLKYWWLKYQSFDGNSSGQGFAVLSHSTWLGSLAWSWCKSVPDRRRHKHTWEICSLNEVEIRFVGILVFCLNVWYSHPVALSRPRNITVHQLIQLLGPARFVSSTSLPEKSPWLKESSSSADAILFCIPPWA